MGVFYSLARGFTAAGVVMMGGVGGLLTLGLWSDRFASPAAAARMFGNEGLLSIGMLLVVAAGLTETGALPAIRAEQCIPQPHAHRAMFMPTVTEWCRRTGLSPSKLLIPLS